MKRYLVKVTDTATENNTANPGAVHMYWYAKGHLCLKSTGAKYLEKDWLTPSMIRRNGYARECDAKRSWHYKHQGDTTGHGWWLSSVEIVCFEV